MAEQEPEHVQDRLPGESSLPIIHGSLSKPEQEREQAAKAKKSYKGRQLALTESNVRFTRTIAIFTVVSAAASIYQGVVGKQSADAAQGALARTTDQFNIGNRAYLSAGPPVEMMGWNMVRIPINNGGHVQTRSTSLRMDYQRIATVNGPITRFIKTLEHRKRTFATKDHISPGQGSYSLVFVTPNAPPEDRKAIAAGDETLIVRGTLAYDAGFGEGDSLFFCFDYQALKKGWEVCGGDSTEIIMDETVMTDH